MHGAGPSESSVSKGIAMIRGLFVTAGLVCLGLGVLGIFLPVLPTTPFLLLAAGCFARSSRRLHRWLHTNRCFGKYIEAYIVHRAVPMKVKIVAVALLWPMIGSSAWSWRA